MEDYKRFHKQWKEADKMFRIPLWKRIVFFNIYRKQYRLTRQLVDEAIGKMPTPTWKPAPKPKPTKRVK